MAVNVISLGISTPSFRKWEKNQNLLRFAEYQKLRLTRTGKLQTQTMTITMQKSGKICAVATQLGCFEVPAEHVIEHIAEILEAARSLPLMVGMQKISVERSGSLPKYGPKVPTRAEEYAERLRQDRWDVRRNGDPADWRLVRA